MVLWLKHMANYHQDPILDPQHPCRARRGNICSLCSYNKMKRQENFPEAQEPESLAYSAVNDSKGGGKQGLIPEVALWPPRASTCTFSGRLKNKDKRLERQLSSCLQEYQVQLLTPTSGGSQTQRTSMQGNWIPVCPPQAPTHRQNILTQAHTHKII